MLTSETIYSPQSLGPLLNLLEIVRAPTPDKQATSLAALSLDNHKASTRTSCLCLIAAKVIYFGVGGGVEEFVKEVKNRRGRVETVLESNIGVGRRVMRLIWY